MQNFCAGESIHTCGDLNLELQPQRGGGDLNKENCIGEKKHPGTAMLVSFMDLSTKLLFHCSVGAPMVIVSLLLIPSR
jgi:hypothetical protein